MKASGLLVLMSLSIPLGVQAGPNAGGTMILHSVVGVNYTTGNSNYCGAGGILGCGFAKTSVPANPGIDKIFYATAAFSAISAPRLKAVSFGIQYDRSEVVLIADGMCGDIELPTPGWPGPGTGVSVIWNAARTTRLTTVYWFAGHVYSSGASTQVALIANPSEGGYFADDSTTPVLDPIAGYGKLGFGTAGYLICP